MESKEINNSDMDAMQEQQQQLSMLPHSPSTNSNIETSLNPSDPDHGKYLILSFWNLLVRCLELFKISFFLLGKWGESMIIYCVRSNPF